MSDEARYAEGGYIEGSPVPWPLDDGYVITRDQLAKLGTAFLDRLNAAHDDEPEP
ncbi:MAG: hypothetical protein ACXVGF_04710 [Blastococcus sp.]